MNYVHWLLEGLLAGRPGPAQRPWDPGELHAAGLRVVVSLNTEPDPLETAAAGLRHYSLPLARMDALVAPMPKGRSLVQGIPASQLFFDDSMITWGRWYRRRHASRS